MEIVNQTALSLVGQNIEKIAEKIAEKHQKEFSLQEMTNLNFIAFFPAIVQKNEKKKVKKMISFFRHFRMNVSSIMIINKKTLLHLFRENLKKIKLISSLHFIFVIIIVCRMISSQNCFTHKTRKLSEVCKRKDNNMCVHVKKKTVKKPVVKTGKTKRLNPCKPVQTHANPCKPVQTHATPLF